MNNSDKAGYKIENNMFDIKKAIIKNEKLHSLIFMKI